MKRKQNKKAQKKRTAQPKIRQRVKRHYIFWVILIAGVALLAIGGVLIFMTVFGDRSKGVRPPIKPEPIPTAAKTETEITDTIPAKRQTVKRQNLTSTNGLAPVVNHIDTDEPVVFLTIDDGANKQDFELQMLKDNNIKASLFLADKFIRNNYDFFKDFVAAGYPVEDHTLTHRLLPGVDLATQKEEICDAADIYEREYGQRPTLVRPSGGSYDENTQRAAVQCGMSAVVTWVAKANGGSMQYQSGYTLHRGDIVLMHFRPEFKSDLQAFINAKNAAGLRTELLEDWL